MSESSAKQNKFNLDYTNEDRFILFRLLSNRLKCDTCHTAPTDTTNPVKFTKFSKIWELFNLTDFEELAPKEINVLLENKTSTNITFETDVLRYLVEIFLNQSNVLQNFFPIINQLEKLLEIAKESNIKLTEYENKISSDKDLIRDMIFTHKDLDALFVLLLSPIRCDAVFTTNTNEKFIHGAPKDNPTTVEEFKIYTRLVTQLNVKSLLTGKTTFEPFTESRTCKLDFETIDYLKELIVRRSNSTDYPAYKFISIINKLDEAKTKNENTN